MAEFHFSRFILAQAKKYGEKTALRFKSLKNGEWQSKSWKSFGEEIKMVARALAKLGFKEEDKLGEFSQNVPEMLVTDFAMYANRGVLVPIYATSSVSQVAYIINDSGLKILLVGEQVQYDKACEAQKDCPGLEWIVAIDPSIRFSEQCKDMSMYFTDFMNLGASEELEELVEQRRQAANEQDLAAILYTSGTTGDPKGVMLIHEGYNWAMFNHEQRLPSLSDKDVSIAFLPLSHVFERLWSYLCLYTGIEIVINLRPADIQQTVKEIKPTCMCSVPRFWEKVYIAVKEKLDSYPPLMLGIVAWALAVGKKHNIDCLRQNIKPSAWLALKYKVADKLIFSKVKRTIGIENGHLFPTAGAALSDHIALFFRSIGIPITYGYGLTESYATVCCYDYTGYEIGSIGSIMPNLEVRIGEDNEIQLRGATVTKGYYNKPEANAAAFTEDGFFRTGDAGYLKGQHLYLTERIKDLFKTSNGKYIAPQQIETLLTSDMYFEQVAVIGDQRNYVTAIIVPNLVALRKYAQENNIPADNDDALVADERVYKFYESRIAKHQANMANFERIKKFTLIKKGFTIEAGELTNTLKLRRAIIYQKYAAQIDAMYESSPETFVVK